MRPHKFWVLLSLIPYPITQDNRILSNSPSSFPLVVFAECSFFWEHSSSVQFSSVAQLCLTLLWPRGLQHTRLTCPSTFPGVFSNSCPLSQWCHPTISSYIPSNVGSCLFCLHLNLNVALQKPDSSLSPRSIFHLALSAITFICPHIHCDYNFFNEIQVH